MLRHARQGHRGVILDLDTNMRVPKVISFDEEKGELEAYQTMPNGEIAQDTQGNFLTYRAKGRFRFVSAEQVRRDGAGSHLAAPPVIAHLAKLSSMPRKAPGSLKEPRRIKMGAPACVKCRSPLTLPGEDLCAPCKAKDRGQRHTMKVERLVNPLLDCPCSVRGCSRLATWSVGDEVDVTPVVGVHLFPDGQRHRVLYLRGATVGRRFYCQRHWQPPRLLDAKGEIIQEFEDGGGLRPD